MTTQTVGAPSTKAWTWKSIKWTEVEKQVNNLQMRIAKAIKLRH